jgi:hypothetical protein
VILKRNQEGEDVLLKRGKDQALGKGTIQIKETKLDAEIQKSFSLPGRNL